jgi:lysophospholipase L1-like esterase
MSNSTSPSPTHSKAEHRAGVGIPANSARARGAQNVIVVLVAFLAVLCLALGLQIMRIGVNAAFTIRWAQVLLAIIGGVLLASALVSIIWRKWRSFQAKVFFSAGVFVVLILLAEGAARIAGFVPAPPHPNWNFWRSDPELGFANAPNCEFRYLSAEGWVTGTTDSSGFRPTITARCLSDAPAVICLGDSTTFSSEMGDDKTWPEAAARYLLSKGKPCRMLNRGVYGYSGLQSLLMLRRTLQNSDNYRGVVYHFCINDPIEDFSEPLPCPILAPAGNSFTINPPSTPLLDSLSAVRFRPEFALLTAFRTWRFSTSDAAYLSGASVGYQFNVVSCERFVNEPRLQEGMKFVIAGMKEECDRHGIPLFVSAVCYPYWDRDGPTRSNFVSLLKPANIADDARVYDESCNTLRQIVTDAGGENIDIRGCLDGMTYRDYVASPLDWHFSPKANERIGEAIARKLEDRIK